MQLNILQGMVKKWQKQKRLAKTIHYIILLMSSEDNTMEKAKNETN